MMIFAGFRPDFIVFFAMLWFSISFTEIIVIIVSYLHENIYSLYVDSGGSTALSASTIMSEVAFGPSLEMFLMDIMMLLLYTSAIGFWAKLLS
jgi:hypothetical protein